MVAMTRPRRTSRRLSEILRANLLTRFNAILGALLAVILVVGPIQDALFGIVLVSNALIGILQEVRARRVLDRLAILAAPSAEVVRDGATMQVAVDEVIAGDLVQVHTGDQIVADGVLTGGGVLEIDESLLSGEAEPVRKVAGERVLSGSFVVGGAGQYLAEHVGDDSYALRLSADAQRFSLVRSELRAGIDTILRWVTWMIAPAATLLVLSQLHAHDDLAEAIRSSVAGVGSMIPEGLVLLTSVAFAVAVIRLGRQHVLVQELAAVEGLARVTVVCVDKTGTLTAPELELAATVTLDDRLHVALPAIVAADATPNATVRAIAKSHAVGQGTTVVPFSSGRRWSATSGDDGTLWLLGAPDVLLPAIEASSSRVHREVDELVARGARTLLVAVALDPVDGDIDPPRCLPIGVLGFEEEIRDDAASTVRYLLDQGLTIKVLSGDDPQTVGAVAARVGIPGADAPVDARSASDEALATATVFGRVDPHRKRAMVKAMQAHGEVVAMTGDGVNDVLALKDADMGIAMGSGSAATRAVAQLVLLDSTWAALPGVIAEGRRVIANVERVANLFVTKTVYALVLALSVGVARLPFPFLPRQLTIVSSLTIGIPAFFLALVPNTTIARAGFARRVLRFAVPAGVVAASATFVGFAVARIDGSLDEARSTATLVLFAVGAWVLVLLARPLTTWRASLVGSMVALFVVIFVSGPLRAIFAIDLPPWPTIGSALVIATVAGAALEAGWAFERHHPEALAASAGRWRRRRRRHRLPGEDLRDRHVEREHDHHQAAADHGVEHEVVRGGDDREEREHRVGDRHPPQR
jgi:cation-transporting ATPase E